MKLETKQAIAIVHQLEALAHLPLKERETGKRKLCGWRKLAEMTAIDIQESYSSKPSQIAAKKRISAELKGFKKDWLQEPENFHKIQTMITRFMETLDTLFYVIQSSVNSKYRNRVEHRSTTESRIECDLTDWLKKAHEILKTVHEGATKEQVKWEDVSCAIALVTGRRQSEIHYSALFTPIDSHTLSFRGQLKGKDSKKDHIDVKLFDQLYEIPCLVPSELVIFAMQWLEREGKRCDRASGSAEVVNKKWGKYLSQRAKAQWQIITDEQWQEIDISDKWTYHKFRCLYYAASLKNYIDDGNDYFSVKKDLADKILGDRDPKTLESYARVKISADSVTRIG
jgi:hypothetical protein